MENNNRNKYNQDWDQNRNRFDPDQDQNLQNEYRQNRNWRNEFGNSGNYGNASYGNQYGQQRDWNQDQNYNRGNMNTGWGSNREDYNRPWEQNRNPSGNSYSNTGRNYGNVNYDRNENRNWWDRAKDEVSSWFDNDDNDRNRSGNRRMVGEHRGKGPKGYTRSDDRIREDVHDRLADDPYIDASDIEIKVENCEVVLTGNVSDREQKRRAEDLVESISGVRHVENRLRVNQEHTAYASNQRRGNYTGNTGNVSDVGNESGTTNEIIRNTGNMNTNR